MSSSSTGTDASLSKSLEELIGEGRASRRGRGRGRGGAGPSRRGRPLGQGARSNGSARSSSYQQAPREGGRRSSTGSSATPSSSSSSPSANATGRVIGDTIFVSNLSKDITADDVTDIFSRVGAVKNASVNYNQNGESQGTAEVSFRNKDDAETAVKEYDRAEVEGRVMYVKIVGQFVQAPTVVRRPQNVPQRPAGRSAPRVDRRESQQQSSRGGGRGGRGRGRGRGGRGGGKTLSRADLDAEMDNFRSGASAGQPAAPASADA